MFSFKRSLIALVGLLVIVGTLATLMPLVSRGQGDIKNPLNRDPRKSYYLTRTNHDGSQALSACATGYHMASFFEIIDTSNLKYDTQLGVTTVDSGSGPPTGVFGSGWIRTGYFQADGSTGPGFSNCKAWTSANEADGGTNAFLFLGTASGDFKEVTPWILGAVSCQFTISVWCMQD
jgi:hypothetical protein